MEKRYEIVDLLKAIGIISIIIGHSTPILPITHIKIGGFVNFYQIMIFFFTAGFLFNEKYKDNVSLFIGKRFYGILKRYVLYNVLFVMLHNLLINASLIKADFYSFSDIVHWLTAGWVLCSNEALLGTFWFLPVLCISSAIFAVAFKFTYVLSKYVKNPERFSIILMTIIALVSAAIGLYTNSMYMFLEYHSQTAFLAIPIFWLGYIVKNKYLIIERFLGLFGCIASATLLYLLVCYNISPTSLVYNHIGSVKLFYPITFVGMYFCLCLAKVFDFPFLSKIKAGLNFIGQNSFHFMALHFLIFKIMDRTISLYNGDPESIASKFPYSYDLGLIYTIVSILVISLMIYLSRKISNYLKNKIQRVLGTIF